MAEALATQLEQHYYQSNHAQSYRIGHGIRIRSLTVITTNERPGWEEDRDKLRYLIRKLNENHPSFDVQRDYVYCQDPSPQELREAKRAFAGDERNDMTDIIFVVVMAHGMSKGSNTFIGLPNPEDRTEFDQLYDVFDGCVSNLSRGNSRILEKPKILVISCCRLHPRRATNVRVQRIGNTDTVDQINKKRLGIMNTNASLNDMKRRLKYMEDSFVQIEKILAKPNSSLEILHHDANETSKTNKRIHDDMYDPTLIPEEPEQAEQIGQQTVEIHERPGLSRMRHYMFIYSVQPGDPSKRTEGYGSHFFQRLASRMEVFSSKESMNDIVTKVTERYMDEAIPESWPQIVSCLVRQINIFTGIWPENRERLPVTERQEEAMDTSDDYIPVPLYGQIDSVNVTLPKLSIQVHVIVTPKLLNATVKMIKKFARKLDTECCSILSDELDDTYVKSHLDIDAVISEGKTGKHSYDVQFEVERASANTLEMCLFLSKSNTLGQRLEEVIQPLLILDELQIKDYKVTIDEAFILNQARGKDLPPIIKTFKDEKTVPGEMFAVPLDAADQVWYKDSKPLTGGLINSSGLVIRNVQVTDSGFYMGTGKQNDRHIQVTCVLNVSESARKLQNVKKKDYEQENKRLKTDHEYQEQTWQRQIDVLTERKGELLKENKSYKQLLAQKEEEVITKNLEIHKKEVENTKLENDMEDKEKELTSKMEDIKMKEKENTELKKLIQEQRHEIVTRCEEVKNKEQENTKLEKKMKEQQDELTSKTEQVMQREEKINNIKLQNISLERDLTSAMKDKLDTENMYKKRVTTGKDMTYQYRATGRDVVEAVLGKLEDSEIFENDKQFLRRIALVESNDGQRSSVGTGGIWQVKRFHFNMIKCGVFKDTLKSHFYMDWSKVTYNDLDKPIFSAIAARLKIAEADIPWGVAEQAETWRTTYANKTLASSRFVEIVTNHEKEHAQKTSYADIAFILDSSGSVALLEYGLMKNFVTNLVKTFNISANAVRVSLIHFSDNAHVDLRFINYSTEYDVIRSIENMPYDQGSYDNTDKALEALNGMVQTEKRPEDVPKMAILITDGESRRKDKTIIEARKLHTAGVEVFVIGIKRYINEDELRMISSEHHYKHFFKCSSFQECKHLEHQIQHRLARAHTSLSIGSLSKMKADIPKKQTRFISFKLTADEILVKLTVDSGSVDLFISYIYKHPNSAVYSYSVSVSASSAPGKVELTIPKTVQECTYEKAYAAITGTGNSTNSCMLEIS